MPKLSLLERYFAQCEAHRTAPLPIFVAGLRDGVLEVNLADLSLADIRLFTLAVMDNVPAVAAASAPIRERRRHGENAESTLGDASSASSAQTQAAVFFTKLHFSYDLSLSRRRLANARRGDDRDASSSVPAPPQLLLAPQNETVLRSLIGAIVQVVKVNASTLKSFAWCGLPIALPSRGPHIGAFSARSNALSLTQLLPLCHHLTCLRFDGVALSRAQFMQLTMISLSSSSADMDSGSWLALEEASFVNCDLTDACKTGIVRLIRVGLPVKTANLYRRPLCGSGVYSADRTVSDPSPFSTTNIAARTSTLRGLRRLDLSQNPLGDETAQAIATAISGSALGSLSLAGTAVSRKAAAMLLLPSVLETNAIELVDLSNTQVSTAYGTSAAATASPSAELRLLADSSIAAGFRVVARGIGQLLVLREAMRMTQQPWRVRTLAMKEAPPSPQSSIVTAAPRISAGTPDGLSAPSGGREKSEGVENDQLKFDPFGAFINTVPATFAAPPTRVIPISQTKEEPAVAAAPALIGVSASPLSIPLQPSQPPQLPSAATPGTAAANPYGPWWPAMASWYAMQHTYPGACDGVAGMPKAGGGWVPVPVPVPVPILAPMPLPSALGTVPWAGAAFNQAPLTTSTASTALKQSEKNDGGPSLARRDDAAEPREHKEEIKDHAAAAPAAATVLQGTKATTGDATETAEEIREEKDVEEAAVAEADAVPSPASLSLADDASSSRLIRQASGEAGGSRFLSALISRLEAHETDVSERLEQHYQRTSSQLTTLEKDMRFRLQQLAEAERKERATAAERQTALLEAIAALQEAPGQSAAEKMSEEMLSQLVHLIEVGMKRVHVALEKGGAEKATDKKLPAKAAASPVAAPTAATATERDMVKEANQRLKQLGW